MKTIYKVSTRNGFERNYFAEKKEANEFAAARSDAKISEIQLEDQQKWFKVYINDHGMLTDSSAMHCAARSESEAREIGEQYIRQWQLYGERVQAIKCVC